MTVRWRNATRRRSNSVKMAAPLAICTKEEQRSVIRFLRSEGVIPIEIHRRTEVEYGDACLSLQESCEWSRKFLNDVSSVTDSPRPGQAHRVVTPEATAAVERGVILEHYMPREHCDQCNVCRPPQESPASCNQVQTTWTSEYRCFVAT